MKNTTTNTETDGGLMDLVGAVSGTGAFASLIENGKSKFCSSGIPNTKNEEWRNTSLKAITSREWRVSETLSKGDVTTWLNPYQEKLKGHFFTVGSSQSVALGEGAIACAFNHLEKKVKELFQEKVGSLIDLSAHPLAALNTALLDDVVCIYVPKNTQIFEPLHLIFVADAETDGELYHPRILVVAEDGSDFTFSTIFLGNDKNYWLNCVSEVFLGENAKTTHFKISELGEQAIHSDNLQVQQQASSVFSSQNVAFSGALTRNDVGSVLAGENAECTLNGVYFGVGREHIDNHTSIHHTTPNCRSYEVYRGILDDKSRGVFNGKIFVDPIAQKTDAKQSNSCVLLSDDAVINTKPQLEIFADDVKCTHGATVGRLDDDAMFYLRSRGIDHVTAKRMLLLAFANEVITNVKNREIKSLFEEKIWNSIR